MILVIINWKLAIKLSYIILRVEFIVTKMFESSAETIV